MRPDEWWDGVSFLRGQCRGEWDARCAIRAVDSNRMLTGEPSLFLALSRLCDRSHEMPTVKHNPPEVFPPYRCYSHATEIRGDARPLIISGLNGYLPDGKTMPDSFEEQGDLAAS